jgi:hypothetical protein
MIFTWRTIPNAVMALWRVAEMWILGRHPIVTYEIAKERQARCLACPLYVARSDQCRACTCMVSLKTLLASERCPHRIPKWTEATRFSSGL